MDMKTAAILGASSRTELHGSIRPYGGGDDSTKPTALTPPACLPQELSKRMTEKGPIGDPWWRFSSKLMGAAFGVRYGCGASTPEAFGFPSGQEPASTQPPTKLTDAAWHRMRPAVLDDGNHHSGRKSPEPAGSGCNPAIGQPFNISWGGRGNTT